MVAAVAVAVVVAVVAVVVAVVAVVAAVAVVATVAAVAAVAAVTVAPPPLLLHVVLHVVLLFLLVPLFHHPPTCRCVSLPFLFPFKHPLKLFAGTQWINLQTELLRQQR